MRAAFVALPLQASERALSGKIRCPDDPLVNSRINSSTLRSLARALHRRDTSPGVSPIGNVRSWSSATLRHPCLWPRF
jgi:hypothetical protein